MTIWKRVGVVVALVLIGVAGAAAPVVADGSTSQDARAIDRYVDEQLDRTGVPGAAYAVVGPEGVVHARTIGEDGDGRAVTRRTPYLWGSVSKPVTATAVVRLVERGELGLDDPVVEHVPDFATADRRSSARITVRQLLDHTSGLPEGLELTDRYDADRSPETVVGQVRDLEPLAGPGERHSYSSLNYVVLAAVVEHVTGEDFGDALRALVLQPAGMDSVPTDPAVAQENLPPGHRYVLGRPRSFDSRIDPATVAAGYLTGSIDDLAAFARTQLDGGSVLDDRARKLLHDPSVRTGDDSSYGLGWRTWHVPGTDQPMVWHGGAAPGYQSSIVLLSDRDLAVVVLQDAYGPFQESSLLDTSWGIASILSGADPREDGVDPLYWVILGVLVLVAVALLVSVVRGVTGLVRGRPGRDGVSRVRRVVGAALRWGGVVVTGAVLLSLPGLLGVQRSQVVLWAPDVAWLLDACLVLLALSVMVMATGVVVRRRRGPDRAATVAS